MATSDNIYVQPNNNVQNEDNKDIYVDNDREEYAIHEGDVYVKGEEDEYVCHDTDLPQSDTRQMASRQEKHIKTSKVNKVKTQKRKNTYGHYNIYLQQIPKRNKCKVQISVEGVYDNESSEVLRTSNQQGNDTLENTQIGYLNIHCLKVPVWKILLGIFGLFLITGTIAAGVITLRGGQTDGKLLNIFI